MSSSGLWASEQLLARPTTACPSAAGVRVVDGAYVGDWWGVRIVLGRVLFPSPVACTLALSWFDIDPSSRATMPMGRRQFDIDPATGFLEVAVPHRGPYMTAILASAGPGFPQTYALSVWNTNRREAPGDLIDSDPAELVNRGNVLLAVGPVNLPNGGSQAFPLPPYAGRVAVWARSTGALVGVRVRCRDYTGLLTIPILQEFIGPGIPNITGRDAMLPALRNEVEFINSDGANRDFWATVTAYPDGNP